MGRAIMDYKMLAEGDKIAVAVSGGKDSLTLLRILLDRKAFVPIEYDVTAIHIDMGYPRSISGKLEKYFKKLKVKYRIIKSDILKKTDKDKINCFWCSWNRRKELFIAANSLGCTKIALIRPLAYVEERLIIRFAREAKLGHDTCLCPHSVTSNRARVGRIIRELEKACPDVKKNIFRSLKRIKQDYLL